MSLTTEVHVFGGGGKGGDGDAGLAGAPAPILDDVVVVPRREDAEGTAEGIHGGGLGVVSEVDGGPQRGDGFLRGDATLARFRRARAAEHARDHRARVGVFGERPAQGFPQRHVPLPPQHLLGLLQP